MDTPTRHTPSEKKTGSLSQLTRTYRKPGALMLTAVVIVLGGILAVYFLLPKGERINKDGYQVVYMVNGQVYFGKLKSTTGDYLVLDTPYSAQDAQPQAEADKVPANTTTLLKVSQQQYGPEDKMSLKGDQVLFWQNLRDDSKVTQAIKNQK